MNRVCPRGRSRPSPPRCTDRRRGRGQRPRQRPDQRQAGMVGACGQASQRRRHLCSAGRERVRSAPCSPNSPTYSSTVRKCLAGRLSSQARTLGCLTGMEGPLALRTLLHFQPGSDRGEAIVQVRVHGRGGHGVVTTAGCGRGGFHRGSPTLNPRVMLKGSWVSRCFRRRGDAVRCWSVSDVGVRR
jgi:hypothetical protein